MELNKTSRNIKLIGEGILLVGFITMFFNVFNKVFNYISIGLLSVSLIIFGINYFLEIKAEKFRNIDRKKELLMELNKENTDASFTLAEDLENDEKRGRKVMIRKLLLGILNIFTALSAIALVIYNLVV